MAYADKDFTPRTGSMIPSHTETQLKHVIHLILEKSLVLALNVSTVGIFGFPFWKNPREKHGFWACTVNYLSNMLKQNTVIYHNKKWSGVKDECALEEFVFCTTKWKPLTYFYTVAYHVYKGKCAIWCLFDIVTFKILFPHFYLILHKVLENISWCVIVIKNVNIRCRTFCSFANCLRMSQLYPSLIWRESTAAG